MAGASKESVVLTLINILIAALASGLGAFKDFPLGVVAGLTVYFIAIAILGAVCGTIVALQKLRRTWIVLLSALAVPALIFYSRLLGLGGLSPWQLYLSAFLFFYIFFVVFLLITHLEKLIGQLGGKKNVGSNNP